MENDPNTPRSAAQRLQFVRTQILKRTRQELADAMGVTHGSVYRWESTERDFIDKRIAKKLRNPKHFQLDI